jgi:hypothetical protein
MFSTRRWIDVLLLAAGAAGVARGWSAPGAVLIASALVVPVLTLVGTRRNGPGAQLYRLVPADVADAHRTLLALAPEAGVVAAADDALLEVAALLGGRPPRGGAQRRFVAGHVQAMRDCTTALAAARAEVEALSPDDPGPEPTTSRAAGPLVAAMVVVLLPTLLAWDIGRGVVHGLLALLDGLAFRARTTARLVVRGAAAVGAVGVAAVRSWGELRERVVMSSREAWRRVVALRMAARLRLRRARRTGWSHARRS